MKSVIEQQVMASVGTIYAARQLVSATALKLYVCAASLLALWQLTWVHRVWENLVEVGWGNAAQFMLSAVLTTELWVQLALLALIFAGVSLVRDISRLSAPRAAH